MKTKDMIARAAALGLGSEADLKKKDDAALTALLRENDPDFKADADASKAGKKGKDERADDDPRTGVKVKCRIEVGADAAEKGPVYACVNGYDFHAPRGKEIELDEGFIDHLETQVVTESEAVIDEKGRPTGELVERDRPRFQVTRLK